jgi:hypothetical protein
MRDERRDGAHKKPRRQQTVIHILDDQLVTHVADAEGKAMRGVMLSCITVTQEAIAYKKEADARHSADIKACMAATVVEERAAHATLHIHLGERYDEWVQAPPGSGIGQTHAPVLQQLQQ